MATILVTGAHGFLGHHVAVALRAAGHRVIGSDRVKNARTDKRARVDAIRDAGGLEFIEADLSKFKSVVLLLKRAKPDVVFHTAAQYSVPYTTENMHHYISSNLVAFTYLLEAAAAVKTCRRVVYASSAAVQDNGRPSGLYGATKAYNEHAAAAYSNRKKLETIGLRYGVIYGPRMRRDTEMLRVVRAFCLGAPIPVTSQTTKHAPFIEISDATELTKRAIEVPLKGKDRCHVLHARANEGTACYADVAVTCEKITGRKAKLPADMVVPRRGRVIDQAPVREVLGFVPSIGLEEGLRIYLPWAMKEAGIA